MADPLGFISGAAGAGFAGFRPQLPAGEAGSASFKDVLMSNIERVNELQQDATAAIEDLAAGRRDDMEGVILATQKADSAFRMLQAVRNKVMQAVEEVKQVRV